MKKDGILDTERVFSGEHIQTQPNEEMPERNAYGGMLSTQRALTNLV